MEERIVVNPKILGGKPIIMGTRLSVEFILELLALDMQNEVYIEMENSCGEEA